MLAKRRAKKSLISFQRPSFIVTKNQRIEYLFELWKMEHPHISWGSYYNHVYRVFNLAKGFLPPKNQLGLEKLSIVAAFHDFDLFVSDNFNYLSNSNTALLTYLESQGMSAWSAELSFILLHHHSISKLTGKPLAEAFRKANLIDLTGGLIKMGANTEFYNALKVTFPSLNFRQKLFKKGLKYGLSHPWNPLPMFKW